MTSVVEFRSIASFYCMYVWIYAYICTYICMCVCMYICMYICMYAHFLRLTCFFSDDICSRISFHSFFLLHVCIYVCMYVCTFPLFELSFFCDICRTAHKSPVMCTGPVFRDLFRQTLPLQLPATINIYTHGHNAKHTNHL
jgi:hypothetical protein